VAFSPDGKLVAAGTVDGRILVWDVESKQLAVPPLTGHSDGAVRLLGFATHGQMRLLASVDQSNHIVLWDVDVARAIAFPPNHHDQPVTSLDFRDDPDGNLTMVSHDAESDVTWKLQLDDTKLRERVCAIVRRDLTPAEEERYLLLDYPFPSSLLSRFTSVSPARCAASLASSGPPPAP
jgi:WD40 repeat protein